MKKGITSKYVVLILSNIIVCLVHMVLCDLFGDNRIGNGLFNFSDYYMVYAFPLYSFIYGVVSYIMVRSIIYPCLCWFGINAAIYPIICYFYNSFLLKYNNLLLSTFYVLMALFGSLVSYVIIKISNASSKK